MSKYIPLSVPNFEGNEKNYVLDAVDQGWVSTGGQYISLLEQQLSRFLNTPDTAACQSGTSGIHLALIESGVGPDDIVIVPTLTFIAAVNPVRYQFAHPVFMDCDDSLCIDPQKLSAFCEFECDFCNNILIHKSTGRKIKALIVVHVFGNLADMEKIIEIAERYNIKVIEDATEALGTKYVSGKYAGRFAGTLGDFGVFSFNGNKIITTGGGGAITSNDPAAVSRIRYLSTQAKDDPLFYIHNSVGYNYRMTNVQAAIGVAQMECLPEFIERKRKNYNYYKELFLDYKFASLIPFRSSTESNCWFYSLLMNSDFVSADIKTIIGELDKAGIQTRSIWGLIHQQLPYKNCETFRIDRAPFYSSRILNLPCSTNITKEEIEYVVWNIKKILGA